jgi:DNA-binding IclR family transcriptional regulator
MTPDLNSSKDSLQKPGTPSVPSVERTLAILESLSEVNTGLTLPELSRRLRLPKSSTHCLLLTLQRRGYLIRNERTHRYMLALKLFSLANVALGGIQLREQALPFLHALMQRCRMTVHMAVLEHDEAVIIEKVEPPPGVHRIPTWVGKRLDLHCSGVGKALIAYLPEERLLSLVDEHRLARYNDNTLTSFRRLKQELEETRRRGYSIEDEEGELGTRCIGAPVLAGPEEAIAAISVAGTTVEIQPETIPQTGDLVKQTAFHIAETISSHQESYVTST